MHTKSSRSNRYPREVRERAMRMVAESRDLHASEWAAISSVAEKLGMKAETLRKWLRQAQIDEGTRPGTTSESSQRIKELERENRELRRANEILIRERLFCARARPTPAEVSRFIDSERRRFGVEPICRALETPVSSYCACKERERSPSARARSDQELLEHIRRVHAENYGVYGARKVWWALMREGRTVARCTVERLMRSEGLQGAVRGRRWRTTIPDCQADRPADLVCRNFKVSAPNRLWVMDFTRVATWSGACYVAFAIDAHSRRIVGWRADTTMKTSLVLDTLEMALWSRDRHGPEVRRGLIAHSDAGSQYTSFAFTQRLIDAGADPSVGSVGDAYDNSLAESTIGL